MRKLSQDFQVVVTFNVIILTVCYNLTEWSRVQHTRAQYPQLQAVGNIWIQTLMRKIQGRAKKWAKRNKRASPGLPKTSETILSMSEQ